MDVPLFFANQVYKCTALDLGIQTVECIMINCPCLSVSINSMKLINRTLIKSLMFPQSKHVSKKLPMN